MRTYIKKALALVFISVLIFSMFPFSVAMATGKPDGKQPALSRILPCDMARQAIELPSDGKESLTPAEQKISFNLLQLVKTELLPKEMTREQLIEQLQSQKQLSRGSARNNRNALLAYVYIQLADGANADGLSEYVTEITDVAQDCSLVVARVDIDRLVELAALDIVKSIQPVTPPQCGSGSVTSEGDALLSADDARAIGKLSGTGIKIGILSDGVNHLASAQATGDLPGPENMIILSDNEGGDEGTAMLEIVHDLAPGAQLYFHDCGDNTVAFISAINELISAGCTVICDDICWLNEPFYEDGYVATQIAALIDSYNITYVTSAGNFAQRHYQGQYRNDGYGYHNFNTGNSSTGNNLYVNIPNGSTVAIRLQWNDSFGSSYNDYDIYLYDTEYGNGYFTAWIRNSQSGYGDPSETIIFTNNTLDSDFAIYVDNFEIAAATRNLEIYITTYKEAGVYTNNIVSGDSIFGHAALPDVISCAALDCAAPNTIEPFSSRGNVTMLSGTRAKPDICGIDGVRITGAGNFGEDVAGVKRFYGTSAAAPHIAAIAALVWQKHPELTSDQVKARICNNNNATDLGAAGCDAVYGNGRANAYYAALDFYQVTFRTNGAGADYTERVPVDTTMAEPVISRVGHTYVGWFKDSGCTMPWVFATDIVIADMELYAKWTVNNYTVSFNTLGSGDAYPPVVAPYGTKITNPGSPAKVSYNFGGWCGDAACQKLWNFNTATVPAGNMTLYARWIPVTLPAPAALRQTGTSYNSVTLGWQAVAWADGYEIWRADSLYGTYSRIASTPSASYTNSSLAFNKTYYYKVTAYRTTAPASPGVSTAPLAAKPLPSAPKLTAAQASYNSIKLSWNAVAGATKYELYRATSLSGKYKLLTTTSSRSYTNKSVTTGTTYYYKIRVYRTVSGKKVYGAYSTVVSAKTGIGSPSGVKAARASSSSVKISWGKVAGRTKYEVWRCSTSAAGTFALAGTTTSTSYLNKKLTKGKAYWYKVRAYRIAGGKKIYGSFTKVVSAKP